MPEVLLALIVVVPFALWIGWLVQRPKRQRAIVVEAAGILGIDPPAAGEMTLSATVDGHSVYIGTAKKSSPSPRNTGEVVCRSVRVELADPTLARSIALGHGEGGVKLGDPEFDAIVEATGDAATVRAVMNEQARLLARWFVDDYGVLGGGDLAWTDHKKGLARPAQALADRVKEMVALAKALERAGTDLPAALRAQVEGDPLAHVQRVCMVHLMQLHLDSPETPAAARAFWGDARAELVAAMHAGDADAVLEHLAAALDIGEPRWLLSHAVDWLHSHALDPGRAFFLDNADRLLDPDDAITSEMVAAVALFRLPELEPKVIAHLGSERGVTVLTCMDVLERIGSLAAVEALQKVAKRHRERAEEVIITLQARLGQDAPGALSVADADQAAEAGLSLER